MWGVAPIFVPARPVATGCTFEVEVAAQLPTGEPLCVLPGSAAAGPRGRFGFVGLPRDIAQVHPGRGQIAAAIDTRPTDGVRLVIFGYELGAPEVFLAPRVPPRGQAYGLVIDLAAAVIVDHERHIYNVVGPDRGSGQRLMAAATRASPPRQPPDPGSAHLVPTFCDSEHRQRICRALEHIAAGDIYQANIARRLRVDGSLNPLAALRALGRDNPVAHGAYIRAGGIELLSNTMETLVTYDPVHRVAASFPIKGTRRRRGNSDCGAQQLTADPKERAEHVMIVDLVRNDLGRVCVPGSVEVPELMGAYGYRGVWHGVSTVRGVLRDDRSPGDLVAALFPGGSITGAPKRRAMEVIADLEGEPRGLYTGSVGVIMPSGRASLSLLIRTLVRDDDGWSIAVGGGIIADSDPQREICETWEKVRVFEALLGDGRDSPRRRRPTTNRATTR